MPRGPGHAAVAGDEAEVPRARVRHLDLVLNAEPNRALVVARLGEALGALLLALAKGLRHSRLSGAYPLGETAAVRLARVRSSRDGGRRDGRGGGAGGGGVGSDVRGDASRGATSDGVRRARLGERRADADGFDRCRAANRVAHVATEEVESELSPRLRRVGWALRTRLGGYVSRQRRAPDLEPLSRRPVVPRRGIARRRVHVSRLCNGFRGRRRRGRTLTHLSPEAKHAHEPPRSPPREASRALASPRARPNSGARSPRR